MEDNTTLTDSVESETKNKKLIDRSAAYPGITIEEAVPFVAGIYKNFPGSQRVSREDIAAVLKTKVANIQRDVAAAVQYGLLIKDKDGYKVSDKYKTLHNHLSEDEKKQCLLDAFGSPKLYAEIIVKHNGHVIPAELKTHLIRFHRIAEKAAPYAAEIFITNGKYVGAIDEHNILNYKTNIETFETGNETPPPPNTPPPNTINPNGNAAPIDGAIVFQNPVNKEQLLLNEVNNAERVKIRLTEGKIAILTHPILLNQKDIDILKKQIELLELLVE